MSQPSNLTEWILGLPIPWLVGGPNGQAAANAEGGLYDLHVQMLKQAVKARMPTQAPDDSLPHIGSERGLIQGGSIAGPAESNSAFGERLQDAWDSAWPFAGTAAAVLSQLYYTLGYTNAVIVQQNGLAYTWTYPGSDDDPTLGITVTTLPGLQAAATPAPPYTKTIPAGTPWWRFDDKTDFCSRFAVLFPAPLPASWTSVISPPTTASAPSLAEVNAIRGIIAQWKNAEATCMGIYVQTSGAMWGRFNWGDGTTWGGTSVVFTP